MMLETTLYTIFMSYITGVSLCALCLCGAGGIMLIVENEKKCIWYILIFIICMVVFGLIFRYVGGITIELV